MSATPQKWTILRPELVSFRALSVRHHDSNRCPRLRPSFYVMRPSMYRGANNRKKIQGHFISWTHRNWVLLEWGQLYSEIAKSDLAIGWTMKRAGCGSFLNILVDPQAGTQCGARDMGLGRLPKSPSFRAFVLVANLGNLCFRLKSSRNHGFPTI